ncbi:Regulator of telomere elongation helicase 1 [Dispira parvispora]|uniref:Regulator of telomere elongation helicase 1 homolog n=1 Tax=Dispira parvispora TaxID=1520584 RepID=A0A9W8ARJ1_9FUNG|nr:Regulator of telomere elongation helicase 1 [Dispira parvispora]
MHTLAIRGVTVQFPVEPYPCQLVLMEKIIASLQGQHNALLESPTGTGKTLCLLCASLAWIESYNTRTKVATYLLEQKLNQPPLTTAPTAGGSSDLAVQLWKLLERLDYAVTGLHRTSLNLHELARATPTRLLYTSRTHSQLSQAIRELGRTSHKVPHAVLGSRQQMCVHPEVTAATSRTARNHLCRVKVKTRTCSFYTALEQPGVQEELINQTLDMEDLVKLGTRRRVCPYYLARSRQSEASVLFLPYNYILHPQLRKSQQLDLKNAVVVFDEAHNLEGQCNDVCSFDLSLRTLQKAIRDLRSYITQTDTGITPSSTDIDDIQWLLSFLTVVQKQVEQDLGSLTEGQEDIRSGTYLLDLLARAGLDSSNQSHYLHTMERIVETITTAVSNPSASEKQILIHGQGEALQNLLASFKILFSMVHQLEGTDTTAFGQQVQRSLKVCLTRLSSPATSHPPPEKSGNVANLQGQLSFWCLHPSFVMTNLVREGTRSVLLTSGTLSPFEFLTTELGLEFKVRLTNGHVVSPDQLSIMILPQGPSGHALTSSFQARGNIRAKMDLGNAIANFSRIVPGGILVFFPSYASMVDNLQLWQNPIDSSKVTIPSSTTMSTTHSIRSIWQRIQASKDIFTEPKDGTQVQPLIRKFYAIVDNPQSKGAVLFAVCRGKVAEGIDFSDRRCRAVIITGLPYPSIKSPKVVMKQALLDENVSRVDLITSTSGEGPAVLNRNGNPTGTAWSGRMWYRLQAIRAVNQAIGRVIRHRNDHGAIILCDERFTSSSIREGLSPWLQPHVRVYQQFGQGQKNPSTWESVTAMSMWDNTTFAKLANRSVEIPSFSPKGHQAVSVESSDGKSKLPRPPSPITTDIQPVPETSTTPLASIKPRKRRKRSRRKKAIGFLESCESIMTDEEYYSMVQILVGFKSRQITVEVMLRDIGRLLHAHQGASLLTQMKPFLFPRHHGLLEQIINEFQTQPDK